MTLTRTAQQDLELAKIPRFDAFVGVGGIGIGRVLALEGNHTLGRNESRSAQQCDVEDRCKLHIVCHYLARLLGAGADEGSVRICPVGLVGDDSEGAQLLEELGQAGMDVSLVGVLEGTSTSLSICLQYPDGSGGNLTLLGGASDQVGSGHAERVRDILTVAGSRAVVLALPEVPVDTRMHLLAMAGTAGAFRVASMTTGDIAHSDIRAILQNVDLFAVNADEFHALTGEELDAESPFHALSLYEQIVEDAQSTTMSLVSSGSSGAFLFDGTQWDFCPAIPVAVKSTAGAGDALLAGTLAGLALGLPPTSNTSQPVDDRSFRKRPIVSALELGVLLASYSVTTYDTIHPMVEFDALAAFAEDQGLTFAGLLAEMPRT